MDNKKYYAIIANGEITSVSTVPVDQYTPAYIWDRFPYKC